MIDIKKPLVSLNGPVTLIAHNDHNFKVTLDGDVMFWVSRKTGDPISKHLDMGFTVTNKKTNRTKAILSVQDTLGDKSMKSFSMIDLVVDNLIKDGLIKGDE